MNRLPLKIAWDSIESREVSDTFVGSIRTGRSIGVKNWQARLNLQQCTDVSAAFDAALHKAAEGDKGLIADQPQWQMFEVEGKRFAVVYGVITERVELNKTYGTYKFVVVFADELKRTLMREFKYFGEVEYA